MFSVDLWINVVNLVNFSSTEKKIYIKGERKGDKIRVEFFHQGHKRYGTRIAKESKK